MFKTVSEVKIDSKTKKVLVEGRRFINPALINFIEEEKTEDEDCPMVYKLNTGNKKVLVSAKDFQLILGNEVVSVLPAGSYKTP